MAKKHSRQRFCYRGEEKKIEEYSSSCSSSDDDECETQSPLSVISEKKRRRRRHVSKGKEDALSKRVQLFATDQISADLLQGVVLSSDTEDNERLDPISPRRFYIPSAENNWSFFACCHSSHHTVGERSSTIPPPPVLPDKTIPAAHSNSRRPNLTLFFTIFVS